MDEAQLISLLGQPDKYDEPREIYRGEYPRFLYIASNYKWFITYGDGEAISDELVQSMVEQRKLFPVYTNSVECFWLQPFSIDLVESQRAWEEKRHHHLVLMAVDANTGKQFPWRQNHSLWDKKEKKAKAIRPFGMTPQQKRAFALFQEHRSFVKVAEILGCTRQNVESLLKRAWMTSSTA